MCLHLADAMGCVRDVVLGLDDVEEYEAEADHYLGSTVGRDANRIAYGRFDLGGRRYQLSQNEPPHHLHGGARRSLERVRWDIDGGDDRQVLLHYRSPDGEEGYPGTVEISAHFRVENDGLSITYDATSDRVTPLKLTNHADLNLSGQATIVNHLLQVHADRILEVDGTQIATGRILPVTDTHFDLRKPVPLRQPLAALSAIGGLDHHFA